MWVQLQELRRKSLSAWRSIKGTFVERLFFFFFIPFFSCNLIIIAMAWNYSNISAAHLFNCEEGIISSIYKMYNMFYYWTKHEIDAVQQRKSPLSQTGLWGYKHHPLIRPPGTKAAFLGCDELIDSDTQTKQGPATDRGHIKAALPTLPVSLDVYSTWHELLRPHQTLSPSPPYAHVCRVDYYCYYFFVMFRACEDLLM